MKANLIFSIIVLGLLNCISSISAQQQIKWTFLTDSCVYSSPTYNNGLLYIGSDDGKLYCLDAESGLKKWEFKTEGIIRCKPAVDKNVVYTASDDGNLYAIDAISGEKKWNYNIGNKLNRIVPEMPIFTGNYWDYMQSSPCVNNGIVYVGSGDSSLYAIEAQDGKLKWRTKTKGIIRSSPFVYEEAVYVGSFDGFIYAFKTDDGSEIWKFRTYVQVQPSPRVANGIVYCGSRSAFFYAIDAKTGKQIWKYDYLGSWVESSAAIMDSVVYVGSSDAKNVYAFKAKTGKQLWKCNANGYPWSSPIYDNGIIYIGYAGFNRDTTIKSGGGILAINAATGKKIWEIDCGKTSTIGGVISSPVVNNNTVYYGSLDGKVYAASTTITSVEDKQGNYDVPNEYKIGSYPNPFNPATKIQFSIPESGKINLSVFDSLGRIVIELFDKYMDAGTYEVNFNANTLSSGVYFPVLRTKNVVKVSKIVYLE